jgi:hypothetical protein
MVGRLKLAAKTRNKHRGYAGQVFNLAVDYGYISANPVTKIKKFRERSNEEDGEISSSQRINWPTLQCRLTDIRRNIEETRNYVTDRMKDLANELKAKADDDNKEDFKKILKDFADQVASDTKNVGPFPRLRLGRHERC